MRASRDAIGSAAISAPDRDEKAPTSTVICRDRALTSDSSKLTIAADGQAPCTRRQQGLSTGLAQRVATAATATTQEGAGRMGVNHPRRGLALILQPRSTA